MRSSPGSLRKTSSINHNAFWLNALCERTAFLAPRLLCFYGYDVSELSKICFVTDRIIGVDKRRVLWYFSVSVGASTGLPQGPFEVPEYHF